MIIDRIFDSYSDCLIQIEHDFSVNLTDNLKHHKVLLRGENYPYEKTESSMKRFLTAEDGKTMKPFHFVSPFIDFEEIYAEYHSKENGLSVEEGVGFLQHYGFPTDLFDFSPSVKTTRFFTCYGGNQKDLGMVGAFLREDLENHCTLSNLSQHPVALRPKNQIAYSARMKTGIINLKDSQCDDLFLSNWYRFKKSNEDLKFVDDHQAITYPSEKEIAFFFARDFDDFFRNHHLYEEMDGEQRQLIEDKLNKIRDQLK